MSMDISNASLTVRHLRCEYLFNPIGIDIKSPRFSWELVSTRRNTMQTAYRIIVAKTMGDLVNESNLLWDTGIILSDNSVHREYEGPPLQSRQRYFWKVRVWDETYLATAWSDIAFWEMGLLDAADWSAKWIEPCQPRVNAEKPLNFTEILAFVGSDKSRTFKELNPCPIMRKTFLAKAGVKRARIYATAHGIYALELNGNRVGNCEFAPEITAYHKYLQYQTYDITELITAGSNVICATLADGWYAGRVSLSGDSCQYGNMLALLLQLEVEYQDGSIQTVNSDEGFKSATGPLVYADIFIGERYDATLEQNDWSTVDYDDNEWTAVNAVNYGYTNLVAQYGEPIRVIGEIQPLRVITTPKGETVIDLGQNIAGRIRMRVSGTAGTEITLEHSEVLDEEGNFLMNIIGRNKDQKDIYVLKGTGEEIYEPRFTFHGFRYVRVTGYPGQVTVYHFKGIVLSSALHATGHFECSDLRINRLQDNIVWSQKANMFSIPTDCPQRERTGFTGDIQVFAPTACFNMDMDAFLSRWLRNVANEQLEDGQIPITVPYFKSIREAFISTFGTHSSAGWGDACIIVPWVLYNTYGDLRVLKENYNTMLRWMKYIEKTALENIPENIEGELTPERRERQKYLWNTSFHFGDWLIPSFSISSDGSAINPMHSAFATKELVSTCFYAYTTEVMAKVADILGRNDETQYYLQLNQKIRDAFTKEYLNGDGRLHAHFQGIYVLALQMNMVPDNMRIKVLDQLIGLIRQNGNKLDTGFVSMPFLMDVLCTNGRKDVAYKLLYQTECPSWLYEIEKGATTIWEAWQAIMPDGKITNVSFNHCAFGCIGDWLYRFIAGLDKGQPGYKHIIIRPEPDEKMTYAKASFHSVYGEIFSGWEKKQGRMLVKVIIPANTTASVYLPNARIADVTEGETRLEGNKGILSCRQAADKVVIAIGSGEYVFEYPYCT